jgi:hypothetical protein
MRARTLPLIAVVGTLASACGGDAPIDITVIAPDGGDPFLGPDAANNAIVYLDDNGMSPRTTLPVDAMGHFAVDIQPHVATEESRLIIEAWRGSELVGSGATPPIVWSGVAGHSAAVLMHRRDTLIPAPDAFATGRAEFQLVPYNAGFVAAITVPRGSTDARVVDYYDLFTHVRGSMAQQVPAGFDDDTAIVTISSQWLLVRGSDVVRYSGSSMLPVSTDGIATVPDGQPLGSTAVGDPTSLDGAAWLVGGHDTAGNPVAFVDRVEENDTNTVVWTQYPSAQQLATPRAHPDVIVLREPTTTTAPLWLVVGGQAHASDPMMELCQPGGSVPTLGIPTTVTPRTGATGVCIAVDAVGCSAALVLGGRDASGAAVADDVLVDGVCARANDTSHCVTSVASLFAHRRSGARAAWAEGGRVLVVGGHDGTSTNDAVYDAESIDVSNPMAPAPGRLVATLPNADPAVITAANLSVMVAGGRRPDGSPGNEVWFYRY